MIKRQHQHSDRTYKGSLVDFIKSRDWHWFITIPIGMCQNEEEVLSRLRKIEAILCGKYLANRFHKLPDEARFSMVVSFEGEVKRGTRHAHILVYIPMPTKKLASQSALSECFPFEFRFLWNKLKRTNPLSPLIEGKFGQAVRRSPWTDITISPANMARNIYTVKSVRQHKYPWTRFEFVTPPKFATFGNENLSVIRNKNWQKRAVLGLR